MGLIPIVSICSPNGIYGSLIIFCTHKRASDLFLASANVFVDYIALPSILVTLALHLFTTDTLYIHDSAQFVCLHIYLLCVYLVSVLSLFITLLCL